MSTTKDSQATIHKIKIHPKWFGYVDMQQKNAELRKNDRDYRVGDYLLLQEWDDGYTQNECLVRITHVLHDYEMKEIRDGFAILSIEKV